MKSIVLRTPRAGLGAAKDVRLEAVKRIRALRRKMNLRTTQAEIRRAISRGEV